MSEEELRQYLIDEIDLQKEFLNQHEVGFIREDEEERLSALETALNLIDKQQKEIEFYKSQELLYMAGYYDGQLQEQFHEQSGVAMHFENNMFDKLKKEKMDLLNIIHKQQKEIEDLKKDISNMYDKEVVRNILEDECGLSKYEIDELLEE